MISFLYVGVGGAVGACLRHVVGLLFLRTSTGTNFPYHTLAVNVSGSFVMGLLVSLFATRLQVSPHVQLFLTTGLLGGFTTFSAFSLETALLYERGQLAQAAMYIILSVALCLLGIFLGLKLGRV